MGVGFGFAAAKFTLPAIGRNKGSYQLSKAMRTERNPSINHG